MFKVTVCTCRERGIGSCGDDVRNRYDTREREGGGGERTLLEGWRGGGAGHREKKRTTVVRPYRSRPRS
jgi:hypothetical protein